MMMRDKVFNFFNFFIALIFTLAIAGIVAVIIFGREGQCGFGEEMECIQVRSADGDMETICGCEVDD